MDKSHSLDPDIDIESFAYAIENIALVFYIKALNEDAWKLLHAANYALSQDPFDKMGRRYYLLKQKNL